MVDRAAILAELYRRNAIRRQARLPPLDIYIEYRHAICVAERSEYEAALAECLRLGIRAPVVYRTSRFVRKAARSDIGFAVKETNPPRLTGVRDSHLQTPSMAAAVSTDADGFVNRSLQSNPSHLRSFLLSS
jgi:hypothetical protein